MRTEKNKEEAIEWLEDGSPIFLSLDDSYFEISDMHDYIGSPEDKEGYISMYLGNVWYSDASEIVNKTIKGMADNDPEKMKEVKFYIE